MIDEREEWKKRLKAIGATQRDLAEELGIDETIVSRYLSGKREPLAGRYKEIEAAVTRLELAETEQANGN